MLAQFARRFRERGPRGVVHQHLREDKRRDGQLAAEVDAGEGTAEHVTAERAGAQQAQVDLVQLD